MSETDRVNNGLNPAVAPLWRVVWDFGHKWSIPVFIFMLITMLAPFALLFWRSDRMGITAAVGLLALIVIVWVIISDRDEKRGVEGK